MAISEDDVDERAEANFKRERPNDIWSIQAIPREVGQDVGTSVGLEVRKQYRKKARQELEAESDA